MINTRIIEIDPRELKLLKMNARFMRHEEFQRLVANVKKDGQLTSAPFAALDPADGKYEVLSGNHRVQAAVSATARSTCQRGFQPSAARMWEQSSLRTASSWGPSSPMCSQEAPPPQAWQNRSASSAVETQSQLSGPTL